jgi:hypothetical protein
MPFPDYALSREKRAETTTNKTLQRRDAESTEIGAEKI